MKILLPKDEEGRYILRLDASLLAHRCPRTIFFLLVRGLVPKDDNQHKMDYGTGGHRAMAHFYGVERDVQASISAAQDYYRKVPVPLNDWRTLAHLTNTLRGYFDHYGDDLSTQAVATERKFEIEWYKDAKVVVYLCGTMDFRGTVDGQPVIMDHKFSAIWKQAWETVPQYVDKRLARFKSSLQGKVYQLGALHEYGEDCGFMINGIFLDKAGKNVFKRSEIFHLDTQQLVDFKQWLSWLIAEIVGDFLDLLEDIPAFLPDGRCDFGEEWACKFKTICPAHNSDPVSCEALEDMEFETRERNPLLFGGNAE